MIEIPLMMTRTFFFLLMVSLVAGCGRRSQKTEAGAEAVSTDDSAGTVAAPSRGSETGLQPIEPYRSVEEIRRDSFSMARIDSLALLPPPSFGSPREAVEAHMRAYVALDAPLMFHICELGFDREPQLILDYQHMMEGLVRLGRFPKSFSIAEMGVEEEMVCKAVVDFTMEDGSVQPMHTEAIRLSSGRWRPVIR